MIALAILYIILSAADWWTTRRLLAVGGIERMPHWRKLIERFGFAGVAIAQAVWVCALLAALFFIHRSFDHDWLPIAVLVILNGSRAYAIHNNWRLAEKRK